MQKTLIMAYENSLNHNNLFFFLFGMTGDEKIPLLNKTKAKMKEICTMYGICILCIHFRTPVNIKVNEASANEKEKYDYGVTTGFNLIRFLEGRRRKNIVRNGIKWFKRKTFERSLWQMIDLLACLFLLIHAIICVTPYCNHIADVICVKMWSAFYSFFLSLSLQLPVTRELSRYLLQIKWIITVKCWFIFTMKLLRSHFNLWPIYPIWMRVVYVFGENQFFDWWKSTI